MSDSMPPLPPEPPLVSAPDSAQRSWALAIHLSALLALLGCTNVVGPLILWLIKRPESAYLDEVGKRVMNFQLSWLIYFVVGGIATFVLTFVFIGLLLIPVLGIGAIAWLVITIVGAIKESNGEPYKFPLTIALLK
jgi:uncharacterized Tic20 family protein